MPSPDMSLSPARVPGKVAGTANGGVDLHAGLETTMKHVTQQSSSTRSATSNQNFCHLFTLEFLDT